MSTTADEITVDIDALDGKAAGADKSKANGADTTEQVTVEASPAGAKPGEKAVVTPEEGVEKLKKQLEAERAARQAAEARANEAAQGEAKARGDAQTSQLDLVKSAIDRVTQANDALEAQYADAMAAQDFKGAAKLQRQMGDNSAKLAQLEAGKAALERAPKPTPRAPADPVEEFCAPLSAASAAWVRAHPEFARDEQKKRQMLAAHELAIARGHKADTPEYFGSIEKTLDVAAPGKTNGADHEDDPMADAAQPAAVQHRAPAAAPVSRGGNGGGSKPNRVKLTPAEVEMAHATFPDSKNPLEDYARQKVALQREGKLQ